MEQPPVSPSFVGIDVSKDRLDVHVLPSKRTFAVARNGKDGKAGGGHRPGTGTPGKSAFPHGWSDDKIIQEIESVANDPTSIRTAQGNGLMRIEGTRDGIDIRVIRDRGSASIHTVHPTNTPRNTWYHGHD